MPVKVTKKVSVSTVNGTISGEDIEVDINEEGAAVARYEGDSEWVGISSESGTESPKTAEDLLALVEAGADNRDNFGNKIPFAL